MNLASFLINVAPFLTRAYANAYEWAKARWFQGESPLQLAPATSTILVDGIEKTVAHQDGPVPPLPADWARWNGARPEVRGAPMNTILNFHGLSTTDATFRAALLDVCDRLLIPVDSMTMVLSHESGLNPHALNPLPAAGIFQLTVGANLPGYTTKDDILALATKTATEQLVPLEAFYKRFGSSLHGANPGKLLLANFLPSFLGKPEDTVLGNIPPELNVGFIPSELVTLTKARNDSGQRFTKEEQIYIWNPGMDVNRDGMITIGDVYAGAASACAAPHGVRMRIDGSLWMPPGMLVGSDPASRTPVT